VVLAICSKNNSEDALAPFSQNPQMLLKTGDFAHMEISWEPKSTGLRRIAETLNLGLDSFVFFDDNPAEREEVCQALPDVSVVEVPVEPSEFVRALESGLWFETTHISESDSKKTAQYQHEMQRRDLQKNFASMADYLRSLDMLGRVQDIDEASMPRVVQLLAKTNQFNLTTRRHSLEEVRRILEQLDGINFAFNLSDKFGNHGLISVLLSAPACEEPEKTLRIDTWLMSCRVIGRTAEQFLFNCLLARARELGYKWIFAEYVPTRKNVLVKDLLDRLGFARCQDTGEGTQSYRLSVNEAALAETFIGAASAEPQIV
jgi:FkbH-like protein